MTHLPIFVFGSILTLVRCGGLEGSCALQAKAMVSKDAGVPDRAPEVAPVVGIGICPTEAPEASSKCSNAGLECKYGAVECPDGSTLFTTTTTCDGEEWKVLMSMVVCPEPEPVVGIGICPTEAPEASSRCSNAGLACKYGAVECLDGSTLFTTTTTCDGEEWKVLMSMVVCPEPEPCPREKPESGSKCNTKDACEYDKTPCRGSIPVSSWAKCKSGKWHVKNPNPMCPHRCPEEQPVALEQCNLKWDVVCNYGTSKCPDGSKLHSVRASCEDSKWDLVVQGVVCPETDCKDSLRESTCRRYKKWCGKFSFMKKRCKRTCDLCS